MNTLRGPVAGVVLAGGQSVRMGREKALIRLYGPEQPDMLARAYALLADMLPLCWVACRSGHAYEGYPCLFDACEGKGPVSGVLEALRAARGNGFSAVLALSCDLPFMDAPTLRGLLEARENAPERSLATLYVNAQNSRPEALTAIYETDSLPLFEAALAQDSRRLNGVIPPERQHRLPYGPENARPFFNLNRPEDLKLALDILTTSS